MYNRTAQSPCSYAVKPMAICLFFSVMVSLSACNGPTVKQYGFLTMLGRDTLAIENITRQGNTLTSDEVDRFPDLRIRHTVVDLNDDGSIRHLEMNIYTPGEPAGQRHRKVLGQHLHFGRLQPAEVEPPIQVQQSRGAVYA